MNPSHFSCPLLCSPFPLSSCHWVKQLSAEILVLMLLSNIFPFPLRGVTDLCFSHRRRLDFRLHWHYYFYFAAFWLSINTVFSNFSPTVPGICHLFLSLASARSYLWVNKLMWVSSVLYVLQEIQKNKTFSDKHQCLKVFSANLRKLCLNSNSAFTDM